MKTYQVWTGRKGAHNGYDHSEYENIEFVGQELGYWRDSDGVWNNDGIDYRVFQTEDGSILINRIRWSRMQNEDTYADILEFASLNDAAKSGWRRVLENAGVIPRRIRSLQEWRAERQNQQS